MNDINALDLNQVSGGQTEHLTVTRKISLNGISEKCINTIQNANLVFTPEISKNSLSSELFVLIHGCAGVEIETISSRIKNAPFETVSYNL